MISGLHAAIAKLPSLSPSLAVNALFTALVATYVPDGQRMRAELIRLCSDAEGQLEAHYADALAAFDNPLDRFPYCRTYVDLSRLEHELLMRYVTGLAGPARVAFVGSGPLPFSSMVLAARHLPATLFDNCDRCAAANERAKRLVRADKDLSIVPHGRRRRPDGELGEFRTGDVADLTGELGELRRRVPRRARRHGGGEEGDGWWRTSAGTWPPARCSWCGARGFLYPVVNPADIGCSGFDVLAVYHPEYEVINSVIVARKAALLAAGENATARRGPQLLQARRRLCAACCASRKGPAGGEVHRREDSSIGAVGGLRSHPSSDDQRPDGGRGEVAASSLDAWTVLLLWPRPG
ncbi:putative nicotianamine synthase 4 [Dichanthelium oligosanthes]|uniref:Nicotianamine synthase n=1 Tax=Dichanthelium oligosanthes TaxID=888268 RepID=A0A1E5VNV3_9POAL|nr:putative nicotianamine synthase 4 [Dichanthelium oligosanthes]